MSHRTFGALALLLPLIVSFGGGTEPGPRPGPPALVSLAVITIIARSPRVACEVGSASPFSAQIVRSGTD
jgi:hypothetical protein